MKRILENIYTVGNSRKRKFAIVTRPGRNYFPKNFAVSSVTMLPQNFYTTSISGVFWTYSGLIFNGNDNKQLSLNNYSVRTISLNRMPSYQIALSNCVDERQPTIEANNMGDGPESVWKKTFGEARDEMKKTGKYLE